MKVPRVPIDDDSTRDETVWRRLHQEHLSPSDLKRPERVAGTPKRGSGPRWRPTGNGRFVCGQEGGQPTPPVLIVVANNIRNAEGDLRLHVAGGESEDGTPRRGAFRELSNVDEQRTLVCGLPAP